MKKLLIFFICLICISLFNTQPIILTKTNQITIEVRGYLKNEGTFSLSHYSTFEDLLKLLDLYEDSDLSRFSYQKILLDKEIIVIEKTQNNLISINSASIEQLCTLKGIGQVTATRIIEYRNNHGGFTDLEDLLNVKGIGKKTFESIKDYIRL